MSFRDPKYQSYFEDNKERNIKRMRKFLCQPCIPSDNLGCKESAELMMQYYRQLGCQEVEMIETESGRPGIWAYLDCGANKTLINYCMLDTKPANPAVWSSHPFEAKIVNREPYGEVIIARGAQGRKAPYISWLNALEAIIALEGRLPVNIMFLAESEENVGSPNYGKFVEKYKDRLSKAQGAFCPGATQTKDGKMRLTLGYKGLINLRFTASGELWGKGPQKHAIHAAAHSLIESPTWRLIQAMATMRDPVTEKMTIKDFYLDEQPVSEEEIAEVKEFVAHFTGKHWKEFLPNIGTDVKSANDDLDNVSATLKYMYSPSFNINGLASGFTGPGTEVFRLPNEAWALCDVRVPRGYSAKKTIQRIKEHLVEKGYGDIDIEVVAAYEPCQSKLDSELFLALTSILDESNIKWLAWPYVGGGGPWSLFAELGMPVMFDVGLGHGGNAGGIDEFLVINNSDKYAGIIDSELFFVEFIKRFAGQ